MKTLKACFITGLVVLLFLSGCAFWGKSADSKPSVRLGLSAPLTKEIASIGEAYLGGAQLAVDEINQRGGINGQRLELIVEDDQCSSKGAEAFNKLINIDKVTAIVGSYCSSAMGPAVPIAERAGVPTIITASAPDLVKNNEYIFRNYPSDALQGKFAAEFIYNQLGKKRAAVIYVKNTWGQGLRDVFVERFRQLGGEIVYDDSVLQDSRDIRTQVLKAKANSPDVLYFPVYAQNAVAGIAQIRELQLDVPVVCGDAVAGEEILQAKDAEGLLYTLAKTNYPADFADKVKKATGKNPNFVSAFTYDAVKILAQAIAKVGTDRKAIRDELSKTVYRNSIAVPVVEFDEQGDLKSAGFEVKVIKDGGVVDYR